MCSIRNIRVLSFHIHVSLNFIFSILDLLFELIMSQSRCIARRPKTITRVKGPPIFVFFSVWEWHMFLNLI